MKKKLAGIINISISNVLSIKRTLEHIGFNVIKFRLFINSISL